MNNNDRIIEEMTRDILALKREVERLSKLIPLYEILSIESSLDLTADQNAWNIAAVDVLRSNPTANRTVNGIANGFIGRKLYIRNQGVFTISFTNNNGAAQATDRIFTPTGGTIVLGTKAFAMFIHGGAAWFMCFPAA